MRHAPRLKLIYACFRFFVHVLHKRRKKQPSKQVLRALHADSCLPVVPVLACFLILVVKHFRSLEVRLCKSQKEPLNAGRDFGKAKRAPLFLHKA